MLLNKLLDKRDFFKPEINVLALNIKSFANKHNLEFDAFKWFEYTHCLLYSGCSPNGKVLDVGSAMSIWPYYLSSIGHKVDSIDIEDSEYRKEVSKIFGVRTLVHDLRIDIKELHNQYDLISSFSVIEHIDRDTDAVLNLAKYLKPGGVIVISTDFYPEHIEYPDANRTIVKDRPEGSHTDSRVYTPDTFIERIIKPLEIVGVKRVGETDFENVDIKDPEERIVRGLYTFGISILKKELSS